MSSVVNGYEIAIKCAYLMNLSTIEMTASFSFETSKPSTKSIEMFVEALLGYW